MLADELLCHGQEEVVATGVEVGGVGALAPLEVGLAELHVGSQDVAVAGGVKMGMP